MKLDLNESDPMFQGKVDYDEFVGMFKTPIPDPKNYPESFCAYVKLYHYLKSIGWGEKQDESTAEAQEAESV